MNLLHSISMLKTTVIIYFTIICVSFLKAQTASLLRTEKVIQRSANSNEKRLEQDLNKEIDKKINQALNPNKDKITDKSSNSVETSSTASSENKSQSSDKTNETKLSKPKTTNKATQTNDTKAHGSLLPPSK